MPVGRKTRMALALGLAVSLDARAAGGSMAPAGPVSPYGEARAAIAAGDCQKALPVLHGMILDANLSTLSDTAAARILYFGFYCAAKSARSAPGLSPDVVGGASFWVTAAESLVRARPHVLNDIPVRGIADFSEELKKTGAVEERRRLLGIVAGADYRPRDPFDHPDRLWLSYAAILADAGDASDAARLLGRIEEPLLLEEARLDKRFTGIVAASAKHFDVRAAADRLLESDRAIMKAHPDAAEAVVRVARDLLVVGRPANALQLVKTALAKQAASPPGQPAFSDWDAQGSLLVETLSFALQDLGRSDDWIAALTQSAHIQERGRPNVGRTINLAAALVELGRGQTALDTLSPFSEVGGRPTSAYGGMWVLSTRVCALAQLGRGAEIPPILAALKEDKADNPEALVDALYCAGDLDGVAAIYIQRLNDPGDRDDVLTTFSDFQNLSGMTISLPWSEKMARLRKEVISRPDVAKALAAVGRSEDIPLQHGRI